MYVPVPVGRDKFDEWNDPTPLTDAMDQWSLVNVKPSRMVGRKRPMVELLFCMLRAGH